MRALHDHIRTYLDSFLVVLDVVSINIVVRADRLLQLRADDMTRALSGRTTGEDHDASTRVLERGLEQTNGNAKRNTSTSERTLVIRNRPRIAL